MSIDTPVMALSLAQRVADFLTHEAALADNHRYDDWLGLWSPDAIYWVPCNEDDYDPKRHVSIIYDDYDRLQERCYRLSMQGAHAQDPPSRLCRVVSNLQIRPRASDTDPVDAEANMILVEVRSGLKNLYAARLEYRLIPDSASFKITKKKIMLLDNDEPQRNLTFLL